MATMGNPEPVLDLRADLGEGSIWNDARQRLHWIDIERHQLYTYDPATGENRACDVGQRIGTVVPRSRGGVMVALQEGFAAVDLDTGRVTMMVRPPDHDPAVLRFNDGKCDPAGRFWAGSMELKKGPQPQGRLYRLDADGSVRVMLRGLGTSNGLAWSLDRRTLYFIDTPLVRVDAFDYDAATGDIANRRTVITIPPDFGHPDGSTLDAEGMLWTALWEGWGVARWNPTTGELLQRIRLPVARVTSCAFGGPDLATLYLTTASHGLSAAQRAEQPLAGSLFRVVPGVRGLRAPSYAG